MAKAQPEASHQEEKLRPITVYLEEEQVEAIEQLAREFTAAYRQRWSRGAVVRLAVGDFLTRQGRFR